ncbi:hypothetical protein L596_008529 [Steinernema carpocapsae]|uniref:Uncharacterized protein n=1 Tax=Steinernema carpocapsae TaxID=34508 RepID=A0A4U5PCS3_STECR|nr:hypothetical protein L596_008529 [Steinernema carpocapsae]
MPHLQKRPKKWIRKLIKFSKDQRELTAILNKATPTSTFSKELVANFFRNETNVDFFFERGLNFALRHSKYAHLFVRIIKEAFLFAIPDLHRKAVLVHFWWQKLWMEMRRRTEFGCLDVVTAKILFTNVKRSREFLQESFPKTSFKVQKKWKRKELSVREENNAQLVKSYKQRLVGFLIVVAEMKRENLYQREEVRLLTLRLNNFQKEKNPRLDCIHKLNYTYAILWLSRLQWDQKLVEFSQDHLWLTRLKLEYWNWKEMHGTENPWRRGDSRISTTQRKLNFFFNNCAPKRILAKEMCEALDVLDEGTEMKAFTIRSVTWILDHRKMAPLFVKVVVEICNEMKKKELSFRYVQKILKAFFEATKFSGNFKDVYTRAQCSDFKVAGIKMSAFKFCGYLALLGEMIRVELHYGIKNQNDLGCRLQLAFKSGRLGGYMYHDEDVKRRLKKQLFAIRWLVDAQESLDERRKRTKTWDYGSLVEPICENLQTDFVTERLQELQDEYVSYLYEHTEWNMSKATAYCKRQLHEHCFAYLDKMAEVGY